MSSENVKKIAANAATAAGRSAERAAFSNKHLREQAALRGMTPAEYSASPILKRQPAVMHDPSENRKGPTTRSMGAPYGASNRRSTRRHRRATRRHRRSN